MQTLAYTTSIMSWNFLRSAIGRARAAQSDTATLDLNLEAPSCVVLSCIAIEAFVNEISSLTNAFLFEENQGGAMRRSASTGASTATEISRQKCQEVAEIRNDSSGSFYDRYKVVLKRLGVEQPTYLPWLSFLRDLRDALVHFRICDVPVVEDSNGVIRYAQEPPDVFAHLKSLCVNNCPIVSADPADDGLDWTLRASTDAMAVWCIDLALDAVLHVLNRLPSSRYRKFILKAYAVCRGVMYAEKSGGICQGGFGEVLGFAAK